MAGIASSDLKAKILGIPVGRRPPARRRIMKMAQCTWNALRRQGMVRGTFPHRKDRLEIFYGPGMPGYALTNPGLEQFKRYLFEKTGIGFDSIYSAKALWGLKEYLREYECKDKKVLFIHTWDGRLYNRIRVPSSRMPQDTPR
jgi:1-aminocyclopropane-1-carboxylate deaminase/D-cysteine desulfhydrase-like pyridoxal-dependent ACC family enzyme